MAPFYVFVYFNSSNIISGVVCISVMVQRPAPISFRLAPMKYTLGIGVKSILNSYQK